MYDSAKMAGLPVGVQFVARPFQEETVLRAMRVLSELRPFTHKPALQL